MFSCIMSIFSRKSLVLYFLQCSFLSSKHTLHSVPGNSLFYHTLMIPVSLSGLASQVVRHNSVEQLLLLGRMLQGTTNFPWKFSRHPAATGTFFTLMLLGLKFCSCQSQGYLQNFKSGLQLLEDRIYRLPQFPFYFNFLSFYFCIFCDAWLALIRVGNETRCDGICQSQSRPVYANGIKKSHFRSFIFFLGQKICPSPIPSHYPEQSQM